VSRNAHGRTDLGATHDFGGRIAREADPGVFAIDNRDPRRLWHPALSKFPEGKIGGRPSGVRGRRRAYGESAAGTRRQRGADAMKREFHSMIRIQAALEG